MLGREALTIAGRLQIVEVTSPLNTTEKLGDFEMLVRTHGFTVPSDMLLNENIIGHMRRELHAARSELSIYIMETLRVHSSIAPKTKAFVKASKPGEPMTTEDFVPIRLALEWRRTRELERPS